MSKSIWVALCVATVSSSAYAQSHHDAAFEHDEEQKALHATMRSERQRVGSFVVPPLHVSYGYFLLPVETRLGPQRHQLQIQQRFPWWGRGDADDAYYSAKARAIEPAIDLRRREIRRAVELLHIDIREARDIVVVEQQHKSLLEGMVRSTQSLVEIGRAQKSDLTRLAVQVARTSDVLEKKEAEIEMRFAELHEYRVDSTNVPDTIQRAEYNGEQSHPWVAQIQRDLDVVSANQERVALSNKPTFVVGATYTEIGSGDSPDPDAGRDALKFTAGVSLPIWGRPKQRDLQALDAKKVALEFRAEAVERSLATRTRVLRLQREEVDRQLDFIGRTSLPLATSAQEDTALDYEVGRGTITDLLRSIDSVHRIEIEQIKLRHQRDRIDIELDFLRGKS